MSIELIRILQFSFCFLVATKCSESAFPTHSYGFLSELIQFIREERCEEETETPHHLPGRANAHSTWALGPATAGLRFRRRLLRKAQYARPRSMCALAGPWSHSHIPCWGPVRYRPVLSLDVHHGAAACTRGWGRNVLRATPPRGGRAPAAARHEHRLSPVGRRAPTRTDKPPRWPTSTGVPWSPVQRALMPSC